MTDVVEGKSGGGDLILYVSNTARVSSPAPPEQLGFRPCGHNYNNVDNIITVLFH